MRLSKVFHVDSKEIKTTRVISKRIGRFYTFYFSQARGKALKVFSIIFRMISPLIVGCSVYLVLALFVFALDKVFPNSLSIDYQSAAFFVCGIAATIIVTVIFTLLFTLASSEEYFREKDLKRFFIIEPIRSITNFELIAQTIVFLVIAIIFSFINARSSIMFCAVSMIFVIYLFVRFLEFKCKHKYENYLYYLKNTGRMRKPRKYQVVYDYISFVDAISNSDKDNVEALKNRLKVYKRYAMYSLDVMDKMMKDEESVVNEQVIIEKYLMYFSNIVETPAQLIALIDIISVYLNTLNKCRSKRIIKTISGSRETILKCFSNCLNSPIKNFLVYDLELDRLPGSAITEEWYNDLIVERSDDIIQAQGALVTIIKNGFDKIIESSKIKFSEKQISTVRSIIEKYENNQKNNAICFGKATNRMSEYVEMIVHQNDELE